MPVLYRVLVAHVLGQWPPQWPVFPPPRSLNLDRPTHRSRSFTNGRDPPGVLVDWIEPGALNDAVFEIDPDNTEFKEAGHIFGQRTIVVAVVPFEVDGY